MIVTAAKNDHLGIVNLILNFWDRSKISEQLEDVNIGLDMQHSIEHQRPWMYDRLFKYVEGHFDRSSYTNALIIALRGAAAIGNIILAKLLIKKPSGQTHDRIIWSPT